ncbi:MAG TPA: NHL repeat-containing protein [Candidatus Deferrimicrobium sp.]|nr:NHL repeat-containing protein [Candidatus Deferrimicrobium sp.]
MARPFKGSIVRPARGSLCLALLLVVSCSHSPRRNQAIEEQPAAPVSILVEREISGSLLGKPLQRPFALAVDKRGTLYVCDAGNNRIVKFSPKLEAVADVGGFGVTEGLFNRPTFISVDNDLNLLVSDVGNRRICRFNSQLQYVESVRFFDDQEPLKFGYSSGVAVTDYGEIWVADQERNCVVVFSPTGRFERFVGDFGYAGGQLHNPEKIVTDSSGNFVVCDAGNRRLAWYDAYGNYLRQIEDEELQYPVAASPDGNRTWVLDRDKGRIVLFDDDGHRIFAAGPAIAGSARALRQPSDVTSLPDGRLVIADTDNHRLLVCRVIFDRP